MTRYGFVLSRLLSYLPNPDLWGLENCLKLKNHLFSHKHAPKLSYSVIYFYFFRDKLWGGGAIVYAYMKCVSWLCSTP